MNDAVFEQAYVFGDNAPFIGCALVLSKSYWTELAGSLGLNPDDSNSLENRQAVHAVVLRIRELTKGFPYYAQPRAALLSLEPWTVENALITPTLKLKRTNLAARFAQGMQEMYNQKPDGR